ERVDRPDVDRELDDELERGHAVAGLERDARDVIAVRVLLPVHAMRDLAGRGHLPGVDLEPIALDLGARVVRGAQAHELWPQQGRLRIAVTTAMLDEYAHGETPSTTDAGSAREFA